MRRALIAPVVIALALAGPAPAAPPSRPVTFVSVDAVKAELDRGARIDVIDVRTDRGFPLDGRAAPR